MHIAPWQKKIIGPLILLVIIILGLVFYFASLETNPPQESVLPRLVTLDGSLDCLPYIERPGQAHILLCAIGLKADDGKYYELRNLNQPLDTGKDVTVTGMLTPGTNETYDSAGVIDVEVIAEAD